MTERYNLLTPSGNPAHNQHVDLYPDHLLFRSYGRPGCCRTSFPGRPCFTKFQCSCHMIGTIK